MRLRCKNELMSRWCWWIAQWSSIDEWLMNNWSSGRNCQIRGDRGKTVKFAEICSWNSWIVRMPRDASREVFFTSQP